MIYIFREKSDGESNTAGNKARKDCETILSEYGDSYMEWSILNRKSMFLKMPFQFISTFINVKKEDIVVLQYPYYTSNIQIQKIMLKALKLLKKKGVKFITLIHDVENIRNLVKLDFNFEVDFLSLSDVLISHNSKMTEWLVESGIKSEIINLDAFDYLIDNKKIQKNEIHKKIVFAGNLDERKSGFIYKLKDLELPIELYGPNFINNNLLAKEVNYKGIYSPEELTNEIKDGFGLIWDGDSVEKCTGKTGNYLRYNNPHKMSLYIACGIPVIVWSECAIAKFVEKNNIGITVKSLHEIKDKLNSLNDEDYNKLMENVCIVRSKVINGEYLKEAMKKALNKLL